jgi:hypothetical protein
MPRRNNRKQETRPRSLSFDNCARKTRYPDEASAEDAAYERTLFNPSLKLGVYPCNICGSWHLTSKSATIKDKP